MEYLDKNQNFITVGFDLPAKVWRIGCYENFHYNSNRWQSSWRNWEPVKDGWLKLSRWTMWVERKLLCNQSFRWRRRARRGWVKAEGDWPRKTCKPQGWGSGLIVNLWLVGCYYYSFCGCIDVGWVGIVGRFGCWSRAKQWRESHPGEMFW